MVYPNSEACKLGFYACKKSSSGMSNIRPADWLQLMELYPGHWAIGGSLEVRGCLPEK